MQLEGQVAIVTGAGTGIGRSTALLLAKAGAAVVLAARTVADLESVAGEITAAGGKALALPTDVSVEEQAEGLIKQTVGTFGRLDILVNNADEVGEVILFLATRGKDIIIPEIAIYPRAFIG